MVEKYTKMSHNVNKDKFLGKQLLWRSRDKTSCENDRPVEQDTMKTDGEKKCHKMTSAGVRKISVSGGFFQMEIISYVEKLR